MIRLRCRRPPTIAVDPPAPAADDNGVSLPAVECPRCAARLAPRACEVTLTGPSDAIARGISMVHQHFMLVPVLSVAENIILGEETMANPIFLDRKEAHRRIVELGKRFGFEIDPDVNVGNLSVGSASVDLVCTRHAHDVDVTVLRRRGDVRVMVVK